MADLRLTLACWDYDRTRPLMDGRVKPEGIELDIQVMRPREIFPRMLQNAEFDVSELSLSGYMTAVAKGDERFTGIPVALSKIFRHSCFYVRTGAGIQRPEDLKGKRVGSINYTSTGVIFMRGLLQHEYGVRPQEMQWVTGQLNPSTERVPPATVALPEGVAVQPVAEGQTLEGMLERGELDALLSLYIPAMFEQGSPRVARLFPDYKRVEQDYYRRTGIFPIMHTVVIRRDVCDEQPWVAGSMYRAFCQARDVALGALYDTDALRAGLPWLIDHIEETWSVLGKDFWSYGVEPNRRTIEALAQYLVEQGFTSRRVAPEELFTLAA
jgi:4,5-dihydroxyphthalate decarboxylase